MARTKGVPAGIEDKLRDDGFEEVGGEVEKWEANKSVQGVYRALNPKRNEKSSPVLVLQESNGTFRRLYAPTILESKLQSVELGKEILVLCLGQTAKIKGRGTMAWDFKLYVR